MMVTSTTSVMVVVMPAEATATRPAATANVVRILMDLEWRFLVQSTEIERRRGSTDGERVDYSKRMWAS